MLDGYATAWLIEQLPVYLKPTPAAFSVDFVPPYASHFVVELSHCGRRVSASRNPVRQLRQSSRGLEPPPCPLARHINMPDKWRWNEIPSYRLNKADVEGYLKQLFGNYKFYTEVRLLARIS